MLSVLTSLAALDQGALVQADIQTAHSSHLSRCKGHHSGGYLVEKLRVDEMIVSLTKWDSLRVKLYAAFVYNTY